MSYVVVFHPCYFTEFDSGCRVYRSDDPYLTDYPSMYQELEAFNTEAEAYEFCEAQPTLEAPEKVSNNQ